MLRYVRKIIGPLTVPSAPSKTCVCLKCVSTIKIQRKTRTRCVSFWKCGEYLWSLALLFLSLVFSLLCPPLYLLLCLPPPLLLKLTTSDSLLFSAFHCLSSFLCHLPRTICVFLSWVILKFPILLKVRVKFLVSLNSREQHLYSSSSQGGKKERGSDDFWVSRIPYAQHTACTG